MSDTGDDGFDKEAEREKLREKYEADQKRREVTEHMSDLLLKGATMTNSHCDDCGSPIFRYDGEAFCPTCAGTREVDQGAADDAADADAGDDDGGNATGSGDEPAARSTGRTAGQGSDPAGGQGGADGGQHDRPQGQAAGGNDRTARGGAERATAGAGDADGELDEADLEAARARLDERTGSRSPSVGGPSPRGSDSRVRQGEVPSMAQSRASLRRAIVSLSEQAAQSDDPGRAHNLLKGAREAAEALAALEGTVGE